MTYQQPILIVSAPRCGSSLLSYILHSEGVQVGICKPADENNKYGYFENIRMRNALIKYLKKNDTNNLGKKYQPINLKEPYKDFDRKIYRALRQENFDKNKPWLFKDPKIALCWNLFAEYYKDAKWVLLRRNIDAVLKSYERTNFMDAYDNPLDWENYLSVFDKNMQTIKKECKNVHEFEIENIFEDNEYEINKLFEFLGIENTGKYKICVDKNIFVNV